MADSREERDSRSGEAGQRSDRQGDRPKFRGAMWLMARMLAPPRAARHGLKRPGASHRRAVKTERVQLVVLVAADAAGAAAAAAGAAPVSETTSQTIFHEPSACGL